MLLSHRCARLPWWISRWFGYRPEPATPVPQQFVLIWSFIGAFCGLSVIQVIFTYAPYFSERHVPGIIASFGATAVLIYGAIDAPLAQPRAVLGGHFISALVGVIVAKLFSSSGGFDSLDHVRWVSASLSTTIAIFLMQVTKTTHPPAGATALLPSVDQEVYTLSWYYLPVVLLSSVIVLVVALLVNNIQRRYPVFWVSPAPPAPSTPITTGNTTLVVMKPSGGSVVLSRQVSQVSRLNSQSSRLQSPTGVDSHMTRLDPVVSRLATQVSKDNNDLERQALTVDGNLGREESP